MISLPTNIFVNSLFGTDAVITTAEPADYSVKGLFNNTFNINNVMNQDREGQNIYFEMETTSVPSILARNDQISIEGNNYKIYSIQNQQNGFTKLMLLRL